jgi:hypothetical protein
LISTFLLYDIGSITFGSSLFLETNMDGKIMPGNVVGSSLIGCLNWI